MDLQKLVDERFLPFLAQLTDSCLDDGQYIRFDKEHPQQLYAVCSYGSIVEISYGIRVLLEERQPTCVPILLRSLFEAYAGFRCCMRDPNHFKGMYATFLNEKLRFVTKVGANPENVYLKGVADSVDVTAEKVSLTKEIDALKAQHYPPMSTWDEFKKAGLESEYQSIYWQLCLHAHNNVSALEDRHIERAGDTYGVTFFKPTDPQDDIRYLDSLCAILIEASRDLHGNFKTPALTNFDARLEQLNVIRKDYA